jgi:hypothetical protein
VNRIDVTSEWIYSAISDFYFAFCTQHKKFKTYATFFEIMGVEKICKGILLFHNASIYEHLNEQGARERIEEELKKRWSHSLKKMLKDIAAIIGQNKLNTILSRRFDGFTGKEFRNVIEKGYMESRYPTANPVYRQFPVKNNHGSTKLFWDPLGSSGLHKFAYRLSQEILLHLKGEESFLDLRKSVEKLLGAEDTGRRFTNLFFDGNIGKYL